MELNTQMGGSGGVGVELDDDTIQWDAITGSTINCAQYKVNAASSGVNVSGGSLITVINIKIPPGKKAILINAKVGGLSGSSNIQLILDNIVRVNAIAVTSGTGNFTLAGSAVTAGNATLITESVSAIVVRDRIVIKASAAANSASASVIFILVKE